MKNRSLWIKILVCVFPFIAVGFIYIFRAALYHLGTFFPACPSYTFFNIYCPGCGNTRSVQHLLEGDIAGSLRYNIVPIFGMIIGAIAYFELITFIFGKHIKIIPRSRKFWTIIIIAFSLYFIIRNFVRLF
ncbi:MAG: DUF2752 domain-containing protein [Ruminiclostridium sp.]